MIAKLATKKHEDEINIFFETHLNKNNEAITCEEFFCPFGVKAAIKRKQVIIILDDDKKIVAATRFYPRKRDGVVSVYQFAIDEQNRGENFLKKMLFVTGYKNFEVLCPLNSKFNNYYEKTGWILKTENKKYNYWNLSLS